MWVTEVKKLRDVPIGDSFQFFDIEPTCVRSEDNSVEFLDEDVRHMYKKEAE